MHVKYIFLVVEVIKNCWVVCWSKKSIEYESSNKWRVFISNSNVRQQLNRNTRLGEMPGGQVGAALADSWDFCKSG